MLDELKGRFLRNKNITIEKEEDLYIINIDRKSRFIMKDSRNLEEKLDGFDLGKICLKLTGDICSKSVKYLHEIGIKRVEGNNI